MLTLVPKTWLLWNFAVMDGADTVADIDLSWLREKGVLRIAGVDHRVYREVPLVGEYFLELRGVRLASAKKRSAFLRSFVVQHGMQRYVLRARYFLGREFVLLDGDKVVGSIAPMSIFTRRSRVDLPDELPLPVRVFMIWLTVILWRRAARD